MIGLRLDEDYERGEGGGMSRGPSTSNPPEGVHDRGNVMKKSNARSGRLDWPEIGRYDRLLRQGEERIYHLERKVRLLESEQMIDPATGLYTAAFFHERLKQEFVRSERYRHFLSVLLLHFDSGNGHSTQSIHQEIRLFGREVLDGSVRRSDVLALYRKRQVAIILPEIDREGAETVSERYRSMFPCFRDRLYHGTIGYPEDVTSLEALLDRLGEVSENLARETRPGPTLVDTETLA